MSPQIFANYHNPNISVKSLSNISDHHSLLNMFRALNGLKDKRLQERHLKAFMNIFGNLAVMAVKAVDPWLCVAIFR